jgi:hypothetical protein
MSLQPNYVDVYGHVSTSHTFPLYCVQQPRALEHRHWPEPGIGFYGYLTHSFKFGSTVIFRVTHRGIATLLGSNFCLWTLHFSSLYISPIRCPQCRRQMRYTYNSHVLRSIPNLESDI